MIRLGLVALALLIGLGGAYLARRPYRAYLAREVEHEAFCRLTERPAPPLRREHIPGVEAHFRGIRYRYNAAGMRDDREVPRRKPAGERRVALLSDSIGTGFCVPQERTLAREIERRLSGTRVLDFAVNGADLVDEFHMLESRALAFAPDALVFLICPNDIHEERRVGEPPDPGPPGVRWSAFAHNVRQITRLVRANGIPLVAGIGPVQEESRAAWAPHERRIRELVAPEATQMVDLWAAFARE